MTFGPANTLQAYLNPEQSFPEDPKTFREVLTLREKQTANCVNIKENAQYEKVEVLTGKQYNSQTIMGAIQTQYSIRLWFDLVALNAGPIPTGVTTLTLTTSTMPSLINIPNSIEIRDQGGSAQNSTLNYGINDPLLAVNPTIWTNVSQQLIITNNTPSALTIATYWMEYIKF